MNLKILKILKSFNLIEEKKYDEKQQIELVKTSTIFNSKWYLSQNPDVKLKKIGAAKHYVKYGWKEGRNPSMEFNTNEYIKKHPEILQNNINPIVHYLYNNKNNANKEKITQERYNLIKNSSFWNEKWYLENNPDVKRAKINPINHYLKYGSGNHRNPSPKFNDKLYSTLYPKIKDKCALEYFEQHKKHIDKFDVLLISSVPQNDGVYIWRIKFLEELLQKNGITCKIEIIPEISDTFFEKIHACKAVIFSRPVCRDPHLSIIKMIKDNNKKLIIDTDDLLFPEYAFCSGGYKSGYTTFSSTKYNMNMHSICFNFADYCSCSTELIKKTIENNLNKSCKVYKNAISDKYLLKNPKKNYSSKELKILYASGSSTHDYDFSNIFLPILNFLLKHQDVKLTILGSSGVGSFFNKITDRIEIINKVDFNCMLDVFEKHDLLLVPLDNNDFNNAKSNIKYIEAGARGTPVLARNCKEFSQVIKDRKNGFLYTPENIEAQLEYIYKNKNKLNKIGENARKDIIKNHITSTDNADFINFIRNIIC